MLHPDRSWLREAVQQARCPFGGLFRTFCDLLFTRSPVPLVQLVQHRQCLPMHVVEVLQLLFPTCVFSLCPDFCASIACRRFRRHPAEVRSETLDLLRLLRQVRPSCGEGFHQPKLPQSVAQNSPPSCIPGQPGPVARCLRRHSPGHPSWHGAPAHVALSLCPDHVSAFQISCSARTIYDRWWQGFRRCLYPRNQPFEGTLQFHLDSVVWADA